MWLGRNTHTHMTAREKRKNDERAKSKIGTCFGVFQLGSRVEPRARGRGVEMERLFLFTPRRRKVEQDLRANEPEG